MQTMRSATQARRGSIDIKDGINMENGNLRPSHCHNDVKRVNDTAANGIHGISIHDQRCLQSGLAEYTGAQYTKCTAIETYQTSILTVLAMHIVTIFLIISFGRKF